MRRTVSAFTAAFLFVLAGCDEPPDGPPVTASTPGTKAVRLADLYHGSGGDDRVLGIRTGKAADGNLVVTVWTRKKSGYPDIDAFDIHLRGYLAGRGVPVSKGYVLTVYGPDGSRLHHLESARQEES
ncbi:hypothetical protein [Streptomyces uncialis]|uniref:hypothetical protein n=1 Tax=Streptomyces uncialis TaxID=1048205 RepID=UPI0033FA25EF